MQKGWQIFLVAVMLAGCCLAGNPPKAAAGRSLPATKLSDSNGAVVDVAELGNSGHWLLVYLQAKNPATDAVMNRLKSEAFRNYAGQFVIIVGGMKVDELAEWSNQFPELTASRWLADPQHSAMRALDLHGVPVQLGIKDNNVEWQLSGAGGGNELFESTMLTWLKKTN